MKKRMYFKIISFILIQAFICLDFFAAGAIASPIDTTTLAPSVAINKIDLQELFYLEAKKNAEQGGQEIVWDDVNEESKPTDYMATISRPSPANNTEAGQQNLLGVSYNPLGIEFVSPPPDQLLAGFFTNANLRNIIPYPFTKKKLQDELSSHGFELITPEMDRKLIAYLLQVLEIQDNQFIKNLKRLNILKIGFKSVITKEGDVKSLTIEGDTLYLSPDFLNYRLAVRVSLLNDSIMAITKNTDLWEYINSNGETAMATSVELGLDKKNADRMLLAMRKIAANYTHLPYWYGFKKFVPVATDNPNMFMRLIRPKGVGEYEYDQNAIGISLKILPKLIQLHMEAPLLWQELVEAAFAHEGGRKGHLMLWPLTNLEEILRIFNWQYLIESQVETIIKDFVNAKSHHEIIMRGSPALKKGDIIQWLPGVAIINMSLHYFGIDSNSTEQLGGVIWKEYAANYGMVSEKGLRAVAIWFWWADNYRGLNVDFEQEHGQFFSFLDTNDWNKMLLMKDEIQKEYNNTMSTNEKSQPRQSIFASLAITTGIALLGFIQALPSLAADGSVAQTTGFGGANILTMVIVGSFLLVGKLVWNIFNKSVEKRTTQLVNKAVRQKNSRDLMAYYQSAKISDKIKIVTIVSQELRGKSGKINLELFESFFLDGLNAQAAPITQDLQNKVKNLFKQTINSEINSREMRAVLNETARDTGINVRQGNPVAIEAKIRDIINSLARAKDLNIDSFIGEIKKDRELSNFFQAQRNHPVSVLADNILKQIIILRETQNPALTKIISKALSQVLPQITTDGNSMFPEIAILVGRLAIEGNLHKPGVFIQQAQNMPAISRIMSSEQMRELHNAIVNLLESGYREPNETKIELVAAELDKGEFNEILSGTLGIASLIMSWSNGTPLSEIGGETKASALYQQLTKHYAFQTFADSERKKVRAIIFDLDNTLINNMALGLVFESVNDIVNDIVDKEIKSLDLKDISKQRARLVLVNTLSRGALLNDLQIVQALEFGNAIEGKVAELRYASAIGLKTISEVGTGTDDMVNKLRKYLNDVPNIHMDLREILEETLKNLPDQEKAEKLAILNSPLVAVESREPIIIQAPAELSSDNLKKVEQLFSFELIDLRVNPNQMVDSAI
ncbi:MAG: hypothetical protein KKD05_08855 [Candidatus Omnitrophica bacterium]|nr:hypothetical protein [Candidatus Omnitrophota bacterium]